MTLFARISVVLASLVALTALAGCVQRTASTPSGSEPMGPIYGTRTVAQTFVPRQLKLIGLDVRLATYARQNDGTVVFRLKRDIADPDDLRTITLDANAIKDSALHRFSFVPLDPFSARLDPSSNELTFVIESTATNEDNSLAVWSIPTSRSPDSRAEDQRLKTADSRAEDERLKTAIYDGEVQDRELVFTPVYEEPLLAAIAGQIGSLARGGAAPWIALIAIFAPGMLFASVFLGRGFGLGDRIAAAPAFSVAAIALATLWATQIGLPLGPPSVAIGLVACLVGLAAWELGHPLPPQWERVGVRVAHPLLRSRRSEGPTRSSAADEEQTTTRPRRWSWPSPGNPLWAALAAVLCGLAVRAVALDGAVVPPGGDAFHHVLIAQLILDRGGVPDSFAPYAPIASYAYHFGFHSVAAAVAMLTGLTALEATSMAALLLNGLIALSVFFAARALKLGDTAAVAAAVVVSLVSPFPAALLDVARLPQTAGLVILPAAASLVLRLARTERPSSMSPGSARPGSTRPGSTRLQAAGVAFLAAGLFLTHYRLAIAFVLIAALAGMWSAVGIARRASPRSMGSQLAPFLVVALGALALVAPWALRLLQQFTLGIRGSEGRYGPEYFSLDRMGADILAHPFLWVLLGLAVLGVAAALVARQREVVILALWAAVLVAFSNPYWLAAPGAGALDSVTVFGCLFFPAALALGYVIQCVKWLIDRPAPRLSAPILAAGLVAMAVWGSIQMPALFHPNDRLADVGDLDAGRWIAASLPPHSRLLVNSAIRPWNPDYVVPTDGGYWMPLLARRATTLLPLLYPGERGVSPSSIDEMERVSRASSLAARSSDALAVLRAAGVTHVYLGARGGPIDEAALQQNPAFRRIYQRDAVSIYELAGAASEMRSAAVSTDPQTATASEGGL